MQKKPIGSHLIISSIVNKSELQSDLIDENDKDKPPASESTADEAATLKAAAEQAAAAATEAAASDVAKLGRDKMRQTT